MAFDIQITKLQRGHNLPRSVPDSEMPSPFRIKEHGMNLCKTFVSCFSLISELAGSNLAQTLLKLLRPNTISHFCKVVLLFFINDEKGSCIIESFPYNHNTIDEI